MQSGKMSNNVYIFPKRKYFPLYSYVLKKNDKQNTSTKS